MNLQESLQSGAIDQLTEANKRLEQQVAEFKKERLVNTGHFGDLAVKFLDLQEKAKAWDDAVKLLKEMNDYLSVSKLEMIGNGSIFHRDIKSIIESIKGEE